MTTEYYKVEDGIPLFKSRKKYICSSNYVKPKGYCPQKIGIIKAILSSIKYKSGLVIGDEHCEFLNQYNFNPLITVDVDPQKLLQSKTNSIKILGDGTDIGLLGTFIVPIKIGFIYFNLHGNKFLNPTIEYVLERHSSITIFSIHENHNLKFYKEHNFISENIRAGLGAGAVYLAYKIGDRGEKENS